MTPLALHDTDCGVRRRWVARWQARTYGRARFLPARSLVRWLLGIRGAAPRVDRLPFGRRYVGPSEYRLARWLFMRMLGGTFFIAFTSLGRQVLGLYGERGISPIKELVESKRLRELGAERFRLIPSVFWKGASNAALVRGCRVGQALSLAPMFNVAPRLSTLLLSGLYLSYVSVGREFLSFQWDVLLLEMGLLGVLTAPPGLRPGPGREAPSAWQVALARALIFRLYLGSGVSKLQSGDRTWRELTAMNHYYETAPLPTRGGWYAHHLPERVQKFSTAATLVLESAVPFLVFAPRKLRHLAFWLFNLLQAAIMATGNYGFFNVQSLVLGFWLLDDEALARVFPRLPAESARARPLWSSVLAGVAAAPVLALGALELSKRFEFSRGKLGLVERLAEWTRPLRWVNPYGLFSVMTVRRPEISIEGSDDGEHWREYVFRYKVSRLDKAPRQVAPHQPRLDWQMWFAALGSPPGWFLLLLVRLLEGSPDVLGLLAENPFPAHPPRFIRAVLYDYRMTDLATRRSSGDWWTRERLGLYVPPLALGRDGRPRIRRDVPQPGSQAL